MIQIYVEAYDEYGLQVLGNLDGQGFFKCKDYKRTAWYKALATRKTLNDRIQLYKIVRLSSRDNCEVLETVANSTHPSWY